MVGNRATPFLVASGYAFALRLYDVQDGDISLTVSRSQATPLARCAQQKTFAT
jgi:hypothetical protein